MFILLVVVVVLVILVAYLAWKKRTKEGSDSSIPFQNLAEKPGADDEETEIRGKEGGLEAEQAERADL